MSPVSRARKGSVRFVARGSHHYALRDTEDGGPSGEDRLVLFVAGDDEEAKAVVSGLIQDIGFESVETGPLKDGGRKQQPGSPIYNNPMTAERARELLANL